MTDAGGAYAGGSPARHRPDWRPSRHPRRPLGGRIWEALDSGDAGARATEQDYWLLQDRGIDARAIPLPAGTDPAQLWREDPTLLRTLLADAAPTAGVAVIDNTVRDLRPGLHAGDVAGYEEFAAAVDTVTAGLSTDQDRAQLNGYADAAGDRLRDQTDQARAGSDHLDLVGERVAAAAAAATKPGQADRLGTTVDGSHDLAERLAGRVGDLGATVNRTAASTPTYDRATAAASTSISDSEARRASSAGFSRPTRDMLTRALARADGKARSKTQPGQTLGRGRAPRRRINRKKRDCPDNGVPA